MRDVCLNNFLTIKIKDWLTEKTTRQCAGILDLKITNLGASERSLLLYSLSSVYIVSHQWKEQGTTDEFENSDAFQAAWWWAVSTGPNCGHGDVLTMWPAGECFIRFWKWAIFSSLNRGAQWSCSWLTALVKPPPPLIVDWLISWYFLLVVNTVTLQQGRMWRMKWFVAVPFIIPL